MHICLSIYLDGKYMYLLNHIILSTFVTNEALSHPSGSILWSTVGALTNGVSTTRSLQALILSTTLFFFRLVLLFCFENIYVYFVCICIYVVRIWFGKYYL